MITKIYPLFQSVRRRFRSAHLKTAITPQPICDVGGKTIGYLEKIAIAGGYLCVSGWVRDCSKVQLLLAGMRTDTTPTMPREDVASATGGPLSVGFSVSLPVTTEAINGTDIAGIAFERSHHAAEKIEPIPLHFFKLRWQLWRLDLKLLTAVLAVSGSVLSWALTRSPAAKQRIIMRLGLNKKTVAASQTLDSAVFAIPDDQASPTTGITIIFPVYNAFDLLPDVIDRILKHTDLPFHLIAINDASTDPAVWPWLQQTLGAVTADATRRVTVLENPTNLGFIGTVNRGLTLALDDADATGPIVLFNSDAFVPNGWAPRLIRPILDDDTIASTTPMSNDAEIFSVPYICAKSDLDATDVDKIDQVARRLNPQANQVTVPTGVGFCMAISRSWLSKIGQLDTGFGRGYGEEVDWCQRARALGGRHVAVRNLFVEHRGGSSFGSADKQALVARNNAVISARYPNYDEDVQQFIALDPMLTERLALGVVWAGQRAQHAGVPLPIYLAHSMGGGAEMHLRRQIAQDIDTAGGCVVVRIGGAARWAIELHTANGVTSGVTSDDAMVRHILDGATGRHFVYSCGVGDIAPHDLPAMWVDLCEPHDRLTVLVHDFFMISPIYTLIDADYLFHQTPCMTTVSAEAAHQFEAADGDIVTLAHWQKSWGVLMDACDDVIVFSEDSASHIRTTYPRSAGKITVLPHRLINTPRAATAPQTGLHIGVLGGINRAKGGLIVQAVAQRIAARTLDAKLTVIGEIDPTITLPSLVTVHGGYSTDNISDLAEHYGITHWVVPSVWPETFSFTTHEALATQLPVLTFDLGGQAEAVRSATNGHVIPYAPLNQTRPVEQLVDNLITIVQTLTPNA